MVMMKTHWRAKQANYFQFHEIFDGKTFFWTCTGKDYQRTDIEGSKILPIKTDLHRARWWKGWSPFHSEPRIDSHGRRYRCIENGHPKNSHTLVTPVHFTVQIMFATVDMEFINKKLLHK